jgi:ribosomal protein S18 acetylase RimI-like enzyme
LTIWRLLPRDEWASKLAGTELEKVWPILPDNAQIVVVEDGDTLAGCWAVYQQTHVEGLYVAPEYRHNPRVGRRLLQAMTNTALATGGATVQTAAVSEDVAAMLEKIGAVELPGRHFVMRIKDTGRM